MVFSHVDNTHTMSMGIRCLRSMDKMGTKAACFSSNFRSKSVDEWASEVEKNKVFHNRFTVENLATIILTNTYIAVASSKQSMNQ